jgi:hypothetical protein
MSNAKTRRSNAKDQKAEINILHSKTTIVNSSDKNNSSFCGGGGGVARTWKGDHHELSSSYHNLSF